MPTAVNPGHAAVVAPAKGSAATTAELAKYRNGSAPENAAPYNLYNTHADHVAAFLLWRDWHGAINAAVEGADAYLTTTPTGGYYARLALWTTRYEAPHNGFFAGTEGSRTEVSNVSFKNYDDYLAEKANFDANAARWTGNWATLRSALVSAGVIDQRVPEALLRGDSIFRAILDDLFFEGAEEFETASFEITVEDERMSIMRTGESGMMLVGTHFVDEDGRIFFGSEEAIMGLGVYTMIGTFASGAITANYAMYQMFWMIMSI
jgi:hypothetical protein